MHVVELDANFLSVKFSFIYYLWFIPCVVYI